MVRKLKYHEKKLLKKVDFIHWETDRNNMKLARTLARYHIKNQDDYTKYNRIAVVIKAVLELIRKLDEYDPVRIESTTKLLQKLYSYGLIESTTDLDECEKIVGTTFCKRRLPFIMTKLGMIKTCKEASNLVEQGHVRVGPEMVKDPAFLVTRNLEDFITWTNSSKIRRNINTFNDDVDDYV